MCRFRPLINTLLNYAEKDGVIDLLCTSIDDIMLKDDFSAV